MGLGDHARKGFEDSGTPTRKIVDEKPPRDTHYKPDGERWQQQPAKTVIEYVPIREDINEKAWHKAKQILARDARNLETLQTLERIKTLVLSGHPNGEGL